MPTVAWTGAPCKWYRGDLRSAPIHHGRCLASWFNASISLPAIILRTERTLYILCSSLFLFTFTHTHTHAHSFADHPVPGLVLISYSFVLNVSIASRFLLLTNDSFPRNHSLTSLNNRKTSPIPFRMTIALPYQSPTSSGSVTRVYFFILKSWTDQLRPQPDPSSLIAHHFQRPTAGRSTQPPAPLPTILIVSPNRQTSFFHDHSPL